MSHVEKGERRRQNGGKGGSGSSNGHKTRSERHYRDNGKKNISPKLSNKSLHRTNSQDQVRRLVEQEGRTARNLVTWSVPVADEKQGGSQRTGDSWKQQVENEREKGKGVPGKRGLSPGAKEKPKTRQVRSRSTSANRKKFDLRARYWSYLFDNLKRAVDEIYTTCETDESVMECQEVIMMLDQCRNDFQALIERIQLQAAFEKADSKDRPQSLAWAVRKLSPGKNAAPSPPPGFACEKTLKNAVRALDYEAKTSDNMDNILSWADRVKGRPSVHNINDEASPPDEMRTTHEERLKQNGFVAINDENMHEDGDGWETVCYNKKTKSPEKVTENVNMKQPAFKNTTNVSNSVKEQSLKNIAKNAPGKYTAKNIVNSDRKTKSVLLEEPVFEEVKPVSNTGQREQNRTKLDEPLGIQQVDSLKDTVNRANRNGAHGEPVTQEINPGENRTPTDEPILQEIASLKELAVVKLGRCPEEDVNLLKGLILSPITGESDLDSEGEDALTASDVEHQKALTAAIEQEADLSMELEKEQELYLASAKEHEEKLAKEKAYQEAYVNALNHSNKNGRHLEDDEGQENVTKEDEETKENPHDSFTRELTWEEIIAEYDEKRTSGSSSSWGDIVESVEYEGRPPGRAVQMHKKLSSPSRKRDLTDGLQKQTEKQEKAQLLREQLLDEKLQHLQTLSEKVAKARELKMMLVGKQESHFREKQRRAEEKRNIKIKEKVRKAQEEEAKVNEIAFINTLEAQNKKMEVLSRHQDHEARLQDLQEERQRKRDEQQAKETAAYERRKQLEAERKARLDEMKQKRQDQEAKFLREKQEKEKAREEAAKEKAREREQRLAARNEALQTAVEQLQLRIKQKQQESTKRHEQMLEFVKEKAAGASRHSTQDDLPNVTPYERKKICTLCNVQIVSEVYLVSHLRGKKHQQAIEDLQKERKIEDAETLSLQYIKEVGFDKGDDNSKASEERKSAFKKRAKKIRARMASRGRDYEAALSDVTKSQESTKKSKIQKVVKDLERYLKTPSSGPWAANRVAALDRSLGELTRLLEPKVTADQVTFCFLGGLSTLCRILLLMEVTSDVQKPFLPPKTLCSVVTVMTFACTNCPETSWYLLLSNKLSIIVDLLAYNLTTLCSTISDKKNNEKDIGRIGDQFLTNLQRLLSTALHSLLICDGKLCVKNLQVGLQPQVCTQRITDLISYVVCLGVVDNLQTCFSSLAGPLENDQVTANFLLESLETLVAIARHHSVRTNDVFNDKHDDPSQFMISVKHTGLVGIITLLYSVLLSDGLRVPSKLPEQLSDEMDAMATKGLRFLNYLATADLDIVQGVLGCEGISLQFRHIIGHSLRVCSVEKNYELLHEVILIIGYFTVLNSDNQVFVQSGRPPTLLQKLCSLPFQYFSNPRLRNILFPTLICSCYQNKQNKEIVEQEVSCALLNNYLEDQYLDLQETTATKSIEKLDEMSKRMAFSRRFPVPHWKTAQEFLSPDMS